MTYYGFIEMVEVIFHSERKINHRCNQRYHENLVLLFIRKKKSQFQTFKDSISAKASPFWYSAPAN